MKPGLGRLLVRLTVGTIFVEHGTQKLFGWFGGPGPTAAGEHFESLGLRPGRANAILAGSTEVAGGLLLGAGLVTPAAAAGLAGVMISALRTTSWATGIRLGTGDYEVLLGAVALALADEGPGPLSLDSARGRERKGPGWAVAALAAGTIASAMALRIARSSSVMSASTWQEENPAPEARQYAESIADGELVPSA